MAKKVVFEIDVETQGLDALDQQIKDIADSSENLEQQFAKLKEAAQEAGDPESFKRLARAAGELKNQIETTDAQINQFASDTSRLDVVIGAVQGIAGAFTAVQGVMALAGDENEEFEKTMQKVAGSLAVLNGLQQVQRSLSKKSAEGAALHAAANKLLNSSFITNIKSMNLFKKALIGTGIGAIVVLLGTLIANFDKVKEAVLNLFPGLGKLADFFDDFKQKAAGVLEYVKTAFSKIGSIIGAALRLDFKKVKEEVQTFGAETSQAYYDGYDKKNKELQEKQAVKDLEQEIKLRKARGEEVLKLEQEIIEKKLKLVEKGSQEELDLLVEQAANEKAIADERQKRLDEEAAKRKKRYEDWKKLEDQRVATIKAARDKILDAQQKELSDLLVKYEEDIKLFKENSDERLLLKEVYEKEKLEIERKYRLLSVDLLIDDFKRRGQLEDQWFITSRNNNEFFIKEVERRKKAFEEFRIELEKTATGEELTKGLEEYAAKIKEIERQELFAKSITGSLEYANTIKKSYEDIFDELRQKIQAGDQTAAEDTERYNALLLERQQRLTLVYEAELALIQERENFTKDTVGFIEGVDATLDKTNNSILLSTQIINQMVEDGLITQEAAFIRIMDLNLKFLDQQVEAVRENNGLTFEAMKEGLDKETELLKFKLDNNLITYKEYYERLEETEEYYGDLRMARQQKIQDFVVQSIYEGLNTVADLTEAFENSGKLSAKRAFNLQKGVAISEAAISTYLSAQKAYTSQIIPGDPTSIGRATIAAALAVVSGLARIAKIKSQKFDETGSGGAGAVSIPAANVYSPIANPFVGNQASGIIQPDTTKVPPYNALRVFVVESDIRNVGDKVQVIETNSKLV